MRTTRALGNGSAIKLCSIRNALTHAGVIVEHGVLTTRTLGKGGAIHHAGIGGIVVNALAHAVRGVVDGVLASGALGDGSAVEGGGHGVVGLSGAFFQAGGVAFELQLVGSA